MYKDLMWLPQILDYLIAENRIPPTIALMLDNPDRLELLCEADFADYVVRKIMTWVQEKYPISKLAQNRLVTGSSCGGLAAAYFGLRYPEVFGKVLSQTGWFRWHPDSAPKFHWLAEQFAAQPKLSLQFYLDVGNLEVAKMSDDGPTQLEANRHMREVLLSKGYEVNYLEFSGGHDYSSLQYPLAQALELLQ
jgi:enterochelin esterase-like enzyme